MSEEVEKRASGSQPVRTLVSSTRPGERVAPSTDRDSRASVHPSVPNFNPGAQESRGTGIEFNKDADNEVEEQTLKLNSCLHGLESTGNACHIIDVQGLGAKSRRRVESNSSGKQEKHGNDLGLEICITCDSAVQPIQKLTSPKIDAAQQKLASKSSVKSESYETELHTTLYSKESDSKPESWQLNHAYGYATEGCTEYVNTQRHTNGAEETPELNIWEENLDRNTSDVGNKRSRSVISLQELKGGLSALHELGRDQDSELSKLKACTYEVEKQWKSSEGDLVVHESVHTKQGGVTLGDISSDLKLQNQDISDLRKTGENIGVQFEKFEENWSVNTSCKSEDRWIPKHTEIECSSDGPNRLRLRSESYKLALEELGTSGEQSSTCKHRQERWNSPSNTWHTLQTQTEDNSGGYKEQYCTQCGHTDELELNNRDKSNDKNRPLRRSGVNTVAPVNVLHQEFHSSNVSVECGSFNSGNCTETSRELQFSPRRVSTGGMACGRSEKSQVLGPRPALSNVTNLETAFSFSEEHTHSVGVLSSRNYKTRSLPRKLKSQSGISFGVRKVSKVTELKSFSSNTPCSSVSSSRRSSVDSTKTLEGYSLSLPTSPPIMETKSPDELRTPSSLSRSGSFKSRPNLPSFASYQRPTLSRRAVSDMTGDQIKAAQKSILSNDFLTKYGSLRPNRRSPRSFPATPSTMSPAGIRSPTSSYEMHHVTPSKRLQTLTERLASLNAARDNITKDFNELQKEKSPLNTRKSPEPKSRELYLSDKSPDDSLKTTEDCIEQISSPVILNEQSFSTDKENVPSTQVSKSDKNTHDNELYEDEVFASDSALEDESQSEPDSENRFDKPGYEAALRAVTTASPTVPTITHPRSRRRSGVEAICNVPQVVSSPDSSREVVFVTSKEDMLSRQRGRVDSSGRSSGKNSNGRFTTHPPGRKEKVPGGEESGSMDSNGFGALRTDSNSHVIKEGELDEQISMQSLADSHLSPTENIVTTYGDVVESVMEGGTGIDRLDVKRNGKSFKQKSKSDPSGDRNESVDIPSVISSAQAQSQSTPLLLEEKDNLSNLPEFQKSEQDTREKSKSDNILPTHQERKPSVHATKEIELSSKGKFIVKPILDENEIVPSRHQRSSTAPDTPASATSTHSSPGEKRPKTLAIPGAGKPVTRSKSAAGLFGKPKDKQKFSYSTSVVSQLGLKDVSPMHKRSMTMEEAFRTAHLSRDRDSLGTSPPGGGSPISQSTHDLSTTRGGSPARGLLSPTALQDKRYHIVKELYNVEQEYVDSLKILVDKYVIPLKAQEILDGSMVDEIFYKTMIPEILTHHAIFLSGLERAWEHWSHKQTVGDIIRGMFSKQSVIESYLLFMKNYRRSEKMIDHALQNKSSFQRFAEQCQRSNRRKLKIKDLIIQPAQRIPRYELLMQRLVDNTPEDHPDYPLLKLAEKSVHDLAMKIGSVDKTRQGEDMQETLKKLELLLLIDDLASPDRVYLRHDMVHVVARKDPCCIWMFSDLIVFSSIKRKSGTISRKTSLLVQSPSGKVDFVENIKHKWWLKIGLDDIEIINSPDTLNKKRHKDKESLEDDLAILTQISELVEKLNSEHQVLEEGVQDLTNTVNNKLSELRPQLASITDMNRIELVATTPEGINNIIVVFSSSEKRKSWEDAFIEAKQNLSVITDKRPPEFMQALQITKTRAGMQFSCAAPIIGLNTNGYCDVWVCNSDGYVGHMCLLSLQPEPIVTLNTPVPGCNSKILCICAVPSYNGPLKRKGSGKEKPYTPPADKNSSPVLERSPVSLELSATDTSDGDESDTESTDEEEEPQIQITPEVERRSLPRGSALIKPVSPLDPVKSTMWLGTDNGYIHIFQSTDNIKTTKNKLKLSHTAGVLCIVHLDNKVFVSLANGDMTVYKRNQEGNWDTLSPHTVSSVGTATAPVTRMLAVAGKVWCGSQTGITVLNPASFTSEVSFHVSADSPSRPVQCMACSGQGVWISIQGSSHVKLFHATTYEHLMDVSVAQAVGQKLMSADDIIRQHKTACLRITSLLACKDLLWVGTSAGVVLTIAIPKISSSTTKAQLQAPVVTGLVHGHTGHVRFLSAVEMPPARPHSEQPLPPTRTRRKSLVGQARATKMLVISGGDGYENFLNSASNETAGRDDSTNHLLLWQV